MGSVQPTADPVAAGSRTDLRIARAVFVFIVATTLAGFAKNFYLRPWFGTRHLIPSAWLHGFVMSAWLVLFAGQVILVALGRVDLHRRVGRVGGWLAAVVVIVGVLTIEVRANLAFPNASLARYALVFVAFDGLSLLLFGVLVTAALRARRIAGIHRRLMTFAMVALLPPAFGRFLAYFTQADIEVAVLALMVLTAAAVVAVDARRLGRVPRASLVPAVLIALVNVATCYAQRSM